VVRQEVRDVPETCSSRLPPLHQSMWSVKSFS
jgi:hypothetical protein